MGFIAAISAASSSSCVGLDAAGFVEAALFVDAVLAGGGATGAGVVVAAAGAFALGAEASVALAPDGCTGVAGSGSVK
ncbi:hypothetical protein COEX109129_42165 [Corallococcus exiguus]